MLIPAIMQIYLLMIPMMLMAVSIRLWKETRVGAAFLLVLAAWILIKGVRQLWLFCFRAVGEELNSKSIAEIFGEKRRRLAKRSAVDAKAIAVLLALWGSIGGVLHFVAWKLGYSGGVFLFYAGGPLAVFFSLGVGSIVLERRSRRISAARLRSAKMNGRSRIALILRASSWKEVGFWLQSELNDVLPSSADVRSFLRFMRAVSQGSSPLGGATLLENTDSLENFGSKDMIRRLIGRLLEFESESKEPGTSGND